jgi:eukaryotic-like serine/threonine-protein kinase
VDHFNGTERYRVIKRLGSGGTGNVYLVYDKRRGHQVALKILRSDSPYSILRFKNEFRGLSELAHSNLINLYDFHHEARRWFFTMEYIDGVDFFEWVRPYNLLLGEHETDLLRLRAAIEDLVKGVATLHLAGHLHRDIKPSNVLVDKSGRLAILDFGLATRLEDQDDRDVRGISGTLEYMAPEQTDGRKPTPAADWYSVGVLLYQAITNELPFKGKPLKIALDKRLKDGPDPRIIVANAPTDLSKLCTALLKCEPSERPSESEIMECLGIEVSASLSLSVSALSMSAKDHLIGREHHLSTLVGAFLLHRHEVTNLIRLHGQSGMGKSALLDAFLNPLREETDTLVLRGRCYQREALTFRAFDQVFDGLARFLSRSEPAFVTSIIPIGISALVTLFPVLQNVQEFARKLSRRLPPSDPQELRKQAFRALQSLLEKLSQHRKVVLCIDDAHHADLESFALIRALLKQPSPSIFVLVAYHSEAESNSAFLLHLTEWLTSGESKLEASELVVGQLNDTDSEKLFRLRLGHHHVTDEVLAGLVREAVGNPFFVELLSSALIDAQLANASVGSSNGDESPSDDPLTLSKIFRKRLKQIPKAARRLLATLAVSEELIPMQVAWTAASVGKEGQRAIATLKSELFVRTRQLDEVDFCEVYHERIRDAVLAELTAKQTNRLKVDVSKALAQQGSVLSQSLFDHYIAEGAIDLARDFAVESGQRAANHFAFERAVQLFEQANDLHAEFMTFPPAPESLETQLSIVRELANALASAGQGIQAARLYLEASKSVEGNESLRLKQKASALFLSSGYLQEGLRACHDVMTELNIDLPLYGPVDVVQFDHLRVESKALMEIVPSELNSIEVTQTPLDVEVAWTIALTLGHIDQVRAIVFHWFTIAQALKSKDPYLISRCMSVQAIFLATTGTAVESQTLALAKNAYDLALLSDKPHAMGLARYGAGVAHFLYGRWGLASHFLGEAVRIFREECQGAVWEQSSAESFLVSSLAAQGEFKDLIRRVPEILSDAQEKGNRYLSTNLRTGYSVLIWLCADDPDTAIRQVDEAMTDWGSDRFTMQHYQALLARVHICLYQGKNQEALRWFGEDEKQLSESQLLQNPFIEMELRILKIRVLLALFSDGDSGITEEALTDVTMQEMTRLFQSTSPWVIALGHYLKTIFDFHQDAAKLSLSQIDTAIRALEGTGLHHYARTARILKGKRLANEEGKRLIFEGLTEMNQRGVQNPTGILRIYLPGVAL